jgi:hypothetical protein
MISRCVVHAMRVNKGSTVLHAAATGSGSDKANKTTTRSTCVPTSLSTRRAPALAWYLGLVIILTAILIVRAATYAPSLNVSVGVSTPTLDNLVEAGKVQKYAGNMSIAKWQHSLSTKDPIEAEETNLKEQLKSRPEVVIKLDAQEPERTCPDGSKGPSFTSLRVSCSRLLCFYSGITCFCMMHALKLWWFKKSYPLQCV